jgi:hypothetical protein
MCSPVQCRKCNKVTWSGCGEHIEYALQGVAEENRCKCEESTKSNSGFFTNMFGN